MLRFLKWIFLVFGGLGFSIMCFFFFQNKHDLQVYFGTKDTLSYEVLQTTCINANEKYYFPCFKESFRKYLTNVSLTGTSLGLKTAFNFVEDDKLNQKLYKTQKEADIRYALNHLVINNLALNNATNRFYGFDFTYGGYVGKIQDFHTKAREFSDGIIEGLKGKEGINSVVDPLKKSEFESDLAIIESEYKDSQDLVSKWLDSEVKRLKALHDV
jgi:hypothetical protein